MHRVLPRRADMPLHGQDARRRRHRVHGPNRKTGPLKASVAAREGNTFDY